MSQPQARTQPAMRPKIGPVVLIKGGIDLPFLVLVLLLLGVGLIMLFSASHAYAYYYDGNSYAYIFRQLAFAVAGVGIMLFVSFFNYKYLNYLSKLAYGISWILVVLTRFMPTRGGARRWIILGSFQFQPSEIAKAALVIMLAHLICTNPKFRGDTRMSTLRLLIVVGIMALPIVIQPHLSATILLACMAVAVMFAGGVKVRHIAFWGILVLAGCALIYIMVPEVRDLFAHSSRRMQNWLDPFQDPLGDGYQSVQSLYAIGSGGLLGVGLGESRQKFMYLPEVQNDFVFAIVCEELGFVGATAVILLFAMLVWRGFTIALKTKDKFGALIVIGLITQVGIQALFNIAVVTNTVPNTGISLPFFSYGGTALVMMLAQMGLILSISRQTNYQKS